MNAKSENAKFAVGDIHCAHCAETVTKAIGGVDSGAEVEVDIDGKTVSVNGFQNVGIIYKAIQDAGYTPSLLSHDSPGGETG